MPSLDWLPADVRSGLRRLQAGEALFRQGDAASAIFAVEQGRLRLVRHTGDHAVTLHTARPGELLAEAALFAHVYHCDAVASVPSLVRTFPKRPLLAAFRGDPALAERFMAVLARQVQVLRGRLEERSIRSARERVLHHLALTADGDRTVRLEGTLKDLADEIGLSHEALYRALAALEKADAIARSPSAITLLGRPDV
jgi:CRP/FNR family transcriptional regulator, dissimilatory nitrate respiration regulator